MNNLQYILFTFGGDYDVDERVLYGWENIDDGDDAAKKQVPGRFAKWRLLLSKASFSSTSLLASFSYNILFHD